MVCRSARINGATHPFRPLWTPALPTSSKPSTPDCTRRSAMASNKFAIIETHVTKFESSKRV